VGEVIVLASGRTVVLHVAWFGAAVMLSRAMAESRPTWELARLEAEHQMRARIKDSMRNTGYVPVGEEQVEVVEDIETWMTHYRMRQRGMEDDNPVWISIREAVSEDQDWLRSVEH
jgi:hypothetical protein